jgi:hypothetical protein
MGVLTAAAVAAWTKSFRAGLPMGATLIAVIAAVLGGYIAREWSCELVKLRTLQPQAFFLGRESRHEYVARRDTSGLPQLGQWWRRQIRQGRTDRHAQVLLLGDYKGYLLPVDYLPDDNLSGYRWRVEVMQAEGDPAKLRRRLLAQNIRYVAVNLGQIEWFHFQEPRLYGRERAAFALYYVQRLLHGHARPLYRTRGLLVLDLGVSPPDQGADPTPDSP